MELDEAKKKLADIRVLVSSTGVEIQTKRVEGNDGNKRIKDLEEEIAQTRQTCLFTHRKIDDLKRKITAFNTEIMDLEEWIEKEELESAIKKFLSNQKDFWDIVLIRTKVAQEEANSDLVGFEITKNPEEFIEEIKTQLSQPRNFGELATYTRQEMSQHKEALRAIGMLQARGKRVDLALKKHPQAIIDRYLSNPIIELWWNK